MKQRSLSGRYKRAIRNRCVAVGVVLLGLIWTLLAQEAIPPAAKSPDPTVELSLIVTDSANKSVKTIRKEDLRLTEDNVEQTVLSVEPDTRPVDCVLAIDASGSFKNLLNSTIEAGRLIIANRRPGDEILIERFISNDKIEKFHDFSTDRDALIKALDSIWIDQGQSAVIDALYVAAQTFKESKKTSKDRRRVVVVITDGEDRNSYYKAEDLVKILRKSDVQIFAVGLTVELGRQAGPTLTNLKDKAENLLKTVAEESGGRAFFPKTKPELINATVQIIDDLDGQFRITYQSTNGAKPGFRKVEVKLISADGEDRKAIARRGYEAGSKSPQVIGTERKSP